MVDKHYDFHINIYSPHMFRSTTSFSKVNIYDKLFVITAQKILQVIYDNLSNSLSASRNLNPLFL